jgi:hypothetical protein
VLVYIYPQAKATLTLYRIAFHSGAKKHLSDTEYTTFRSWTKQHFSVAIIPLKIAFLKGTDRRFLRRYGSYPVQCQHVAFITQFFILQYFSDYKTVCGMYEIIFSLYNYITYRLTTICCRIVLRAWFPYSRNGRKNNDLSQRPVSNSLYL